jgi:hypothetical protein
MNTQHLQQAKKAALKALLPQDRPGNVVGIGIGKKSVNGQPTPTDCLRIYVVSKLVPNHLSPAELVPLDFEGVPTDVVEIGRLGRNGRTSTANTQPNSTPTPGSSIRVDTKAPNVNSGATGTLGMVVSYANERYILGCNHVLAVNGRVLEDPDAKIVSAVFAGDEPPIANVDPHYVPIRSGDNIVDCALAHVNERNQVSAAFPAAFGDLKPRPKDPQPRMRVKKLGAATLTTYGTIAESSIDLDVNFDFGTYRFVNQIVVEGDLEEFATAGDSGSIIVDEESQQPVGMVFAASGKHAIACPLSAVLESLQELLPKGKDGKVPLSLVFHDA